MRAGFSNGREAVFCFLAILAISVAVIGFGLPSGQVEPALAACISGAAKCDPGCSPTPADCASDCCSGCSYCGGGANPPGGRYHFGQPPADPKPWVWNGSGTTLKFEGKESVKFCFMVPVGRDRPTWVKLDLFDPYGGAERKGQIRIPVFQGYDTDADFPDSNGEESDWAGTTASGTMVTIGGMTYVKICLDLSKLKTEPFDADPKQYIGIGVQTGYPTQDDDFWSSVFWGNRMEAIADIDAGGESTDSPIRVPLAENDALPETLTFRNTISMYVPDDVEQLQRLSGSCGIYRNGALQEVVAIENGVLNLDVPTDGVSYYEISTAVNDELFGTFGLRFEIVDGQLHVYDESRNDQEIPYFEDSDGTYRLDFWNYETRVLICGESEDADGPLIGPAYLQAQE